MHLFIGKPHLDLAKAADTLLTPAFAIGKYNTSVHSSRRAAAVKCHLTDRRVLAFLNRQQAWCCEGLHSSSSRDLQHPVDQKQKALPPHSQPSTERRHQYLGTCEKTQSPPNPAESQWWAGPPCEEIRGQVPFSIRLAALNVKQLLPICGVHLAACTQWKKYLEPSKAQSGAACSTLPPPELAAGSLGLSARS